MIEAITLYNFLSFKEKTEFSFIASSEKSKKGFEHIEWFTNINNKKILKTLFLFGNNGTGKSNFLSAINIIRLLVCRRKSSKSDSKNELPDTFFRFSSQTIDKPSKISVVFHIGTNRYIYNVSWNQSVILEESLFLLNKRNKEDLVFSRTHNLEKDIVDVIFPKKSSCPTSSQQIIKENVIANTSVISLYDEKNIESLELKEVYNYFRNFIVVQTLDDRMLDLCPMLTRRKNEAVLKNVLLKLLRDLGSNILDYEVIKTTRRLEQIEIDILHSQMPAEVYNERFPNDTKVDLHIRFAHKSIDSDEYCWLTEGMESEGTINMIKLIIVLFDAAWNNASIAIDECAMGIHQETFNRIIQFYLSIANNSQAILASQALPILDMEGYRRDTARFFDKDFETGISSCFSIDLRKFHINKNIYKNYVDHTFGGKPQLPLAEEWKQHLYDFRDIVSSQSGS